MKLEKYRIAFGDSIKQLENRVNMLIEVGYVPHKNLIILDTPEHLIGENTAPRFYMQAMLKYEE
ncbi:MAG: hypothetical protein HN952_08420 [Candidatus Cloacimonetes bacterium]|jgi:hypothetical protein|nr:hypothetical protein [Candidatus Cloacimonadota bacterium]MBT6994959.1 hypothetical protein [Candidatus Cloacimonadota bacterium]MBT7469919.1 hypothetical protein [Candidatus Cloacimonadota bacterium]